ncbi:MAG: hypothetical protein ACO1QB_16625 [Verrucomicrobiales bacterium]
MIFLAKMEPKQNKNGAARIAINLFIIFHLMIMILWGLPGSAFRTSLVRWFEPYVIKSGLWHGWDMFSPNPLSLNFNVEAQIVRQDGSTNSWYFPRMEKLGYVKRHQMERYRKWRERVRQDSFARVWDDTCKWIARENWNETNPPVQVSLIRHWSAIQPPIPDQSLQPIPDEYGFNFNYKFKTYHVPPDFRP